MCDIYLHNYLGYRLVILICLFVYKKLEVNSYDGVNIQVLEKVDYGLYWSQIYSPSDSKSNLGSYLGHDSLDH